MPSFIKVPLAQAQKAKLALMQQGAFSDKYHYDRDDDFIYYPVKEGCHTTEYTIVQRQAKPLIKPLPLKKALGNTLTEDQIQRVKTSYDTVGTIAILEIDEELQPFENVIANALLATNKQIKTVVAKQGIHEGEFRTQQHRHIAGEQTSLTIHKENGCKLNVDINATYFSPRLSTERKRIAELVRPGERVLVMFSGAAPYPCVLSKNTKAHSIVGVEKNPEAHSLGLANIKLNKIKNVSLYCGDVTAIVPTLGVFDRVLMPLPKSADEFLSIGIPAVKKGGVLHFYDFLHEELFEEAKKKVAKAARKLSRTANFITVVRCGQHAPRVYRICVDVVLE